MYLVSDTTLGLGIGQQIKWSLSLGCSMLFHVPLHSWELLNALMSYLHKQRSGWPLTASLSHPYVAAASKPGKVRICLLHLLPKIITVSNVYRGLATWHPVKHVTWCNSSNPHNHHIKQGRYVMGYFISQTRKPRHSSAGGPIQWVHPRFTPLAEIPTPALVPLYHLLLLFKSHFLILVWSEKHHVTSVVVSTLLVIKGSKYRELRQEQMGSVGWEFS